MATALVDPSTGVSLPKTILIPAAVAAAIGLVALRGFETADERICAPVEMCGAETVRLLDLPGQDASIPLKDLRRTVTRQR